MDEGKDPQVALHIVETHEYSADLGIISKISWKKGRGSIRLEVPYDGALLKFEGPVARNYKIGSIELSEPNREEPVSFPISLPAGNSWQENLKGGRRFIQTAEYELEEPADQLIAIDGDVLDDVLINSKTTDCDRIFGSIDTYQNPLTLQLSLWVPDQLMSTQIDQRRLLEGLVRRGENSRQIFIPNLGWLNFERRLAENMTALANSSGGTILIGVDSSKRIVGISPDNETRKRLISHILKAALLSSPPILLSPLIKFRHLATGRHVYRIDVSQTRGRKHRIGNIVFTRRGKVNIKHSQPAVDVDVQTEASSEGFNMEEGVIQDESGNISFLNSQNVAVLDASQGLSNLNIGAYLCGLINSNRADGRIIVTNLNNSSGGLLRSIFRSRVSLNTAVENETAKITPPLAKTGCRRAFYRQSKCRHYSCPDL